ncbi:MAG: PspC domain-containing protein [Bacteroidales bacterium]|nr:PspC domain-containing protein [Bacteroidales bacterium]MBP5518433.1 PspC domain-containing protein [Bacteroidales bacterium]
MEEVLKVSIGGVSFAINKDGYNRLDYYLRGIESHYSRRPGGKEIVDDIESRIAELLLEKNSKDDVVTLERVEGVIAVMGNPSQFDDEEEASGASARQADNVSGQAQRTFEKEPARRLFRDTDDRMIGGVCSGIAHYFKFDPSILRIILGIVIALHFVGRPFLFSHGVFGYHLISSLFTMCFIGYIILWIVVPSAKTYSQRCQMMGSDPGVRGAEERFENPHRPSGWWLGRIVKVLLGLFFIFMGLCGFGLIGGTVMGSDMLFGVNPVRAVSYLEMSPWLRIVMKTSMILVAVIPCLAFLYVGIRWLFNLKRPKYRPGLIMFLLWLAAVITASAIGGSSSDMIPGRGGRYASVTKAFPKHYDTLYVQYAPLPESQDGETYNWEQMKERFRKFNRRNAGVYVSWNGRQIDDNSGEEEYTVDSEQSYSGDFYAFVSSGKKATRAYAIYPELDIDHKSSTTIVDDTTSADALKVIRDTTITADMEISVGRVPFLERWRNFEDKSEQAQALVEVTDSLITLKPIVITKKKKYDGTYVSTRLCIPDSSVVIIKTPLQ